MALTGKDRLDLQARTRDESQARDLEVNSRAGTGATVFREVIIESV